MMYEKIICRLAGWVSICSILVSCSESKTKVKLDYMSVSGVVSGFRYDESVYIQQIYGPASVWRQICRLLFIFQENTHNQSGRRIVI